jgi:3-oxoacyl-[acyl-carrier-protein] synthase-3
MATSIISNATTTASHNSSIKRSALAVQECIARAGVEAIDLLVNTGIYRDDNVVEPAAAALIQKHAGIGLQYSRHASPMLSFDLMDGPCGFLDAVEIAAAIFGTTEGRSCVVVSGDGHPSRSPRPDPSFPYLGSSAATLLMNSADGSGFGSVYRVGSPPQNPLGYVDIATMGLIGRTFVTVDEPDGITREQGQQVAIDVTRLCLESEGIDPADCVLVASEPRTGFAKTVAAAVQIDQVVTPSTTGNPHTAALPFAYQALLEAEPARTEGHALFLAADGHFSAACADYRLSSTDVLPGLAG